MMASFALMQPTFAPWIGYMLLAKKVDFFVFYDTADFSRQSFHHRNRFSCNGVSKWITLPTTSRFTPLNQTSVDKSKVVSICQKLQNYYTKSALRDEFIDLIHDEYMACANLAQGNIAIIRRCFEILKIKCEVLQASEFATSSSGIKTIIDIGQQAQFTRYISPSGSLVYMNDADHLDLEKAFTNGCKFQDFYTAVMSSRLLHGDPPMSCLHHFFIHDISDIQENFANMERKI